MLGKLFGKKAEAAVQKFSGRTDFLEATCAAAALIAAADGEIEPAEQKLLETLAKDLGLDLSRLAA